MSGVQFYRLNVNTGIIETGLAVPLRLKTTCACHGTAKPEN